MHIDNAFTRALGLAQPIIQAPMGGGNATPPELVSAVNNAGGLGFIGAAYMTPQQIADNATRIKSLTRRPFGINLFVPTPTAPLPADADRALAALRPYHAELGLAPPELPQSAVSSFDDQLSATLDSGARVFSFTFGALSAAAIRKIRARGMYVIGTATTVEEALALERSGVDAVAAQGSDAGAHRGTFLRPASESLIGTMSLIPQVVDAVKVPVIASGGIMDGRGVYAALALGASAVQMGTAFLTVDECGIVPAYKQAIHAAREDDTMLTRAFSGRTARGIVNRVMREVELENPDPPILPFPVQNNLTRPLRNAATAANRPEFLSLWAGQALRLARRTSAQELVAQIAREMDEVHERLERQRRAWAD